MLLAVGVRADGSADVGTAEVEDVQRQYEALFLRRGRSRVLLAAGEYTGDTNHRATNCATTDFVC